MEGGTLRLDSQTQKTKILKWAIQKLFQSEANSIGKEETISQGKIIENMNFIWLKETLYLFILEVLTQFSIFLFLFYWLCYYHCPDLSSIAPLHPAPPTPSGNPPTIVYIHSSCVKVLWLLHLKCSEFLNVILPNVYRGVQK